MASVVYEELKNFSIIAWLIRNLRRCKNGQDFRRYRKNIYAGFFL